MPLERIYIARHGFRLNWHFNDWTSPTGLARDIPLTAYGEIQAGVLAQHILSLPEDERPTAVFSSAWYRCIQTSDPIAKALGVPIYVDQGFGEWFSPATPGSGLHPRPGPTSSLVQHFPTIDPRYQLTWLPSRHGENVSEVHVRTSSFLRAFFARLDLAALGAPIASDRELDLGRHKNILLVGHAASVITLARELSGERDLALRVGCCSLSILVPKPGAKRFTYRLPPASASSPTPMPHATHTEGNALLGEWELTLNASADFLPNGIERDWGFEDIEVDSGEVISDFGEKGTEGEVESEHERGLQIQLPGEVMGARL